MKPAPEPYHYGSPAAGEHFCDREDTLAELRDRMLLGGNVILLSPRRYGKTSVLLRAIDQVRAAGGATGYVSLIGCSNRREVAETVTSGILNGPLGWLARRQAGLRDLLRELRISPAMTVDASGAVSISFTGRLASGDWSAVLADSLRLLARRAGRKPTSFVLDEFQKVMEIDPALGGVFKAVSDELHGVSLVFAGSKLHLMHRLASEPGAPLLGIAERLSLDVIPEAVMAPFIAERARAAGKPMPDAAASALYRLVDGIPNDVQRLAFEAFLLAGEVVDEACIETAMQRIVSHQATDFAELYERFAPTQQRVLRALARQPERAVYGAEFLSAVDAVNTNAVRAAIQVLESRELIRKTRGEWCVGNCFLRSWLRDL